MFFLYNFHSIHDDKSQPTFIMSKKSNIKQQLGSPASGKALKKSNRTKEKRKKNKIKGKIAPSAKKKKEKLVKSSKSAKIAKHDLNNVIHQQKRSILIQKKKKNLTKTNKTRASDALSRFSTSKQQTVPDESKITQKKKKKKKKVKPVKFDYKFPLIEGIPLQEFAVMNMPWYRAEFQTRFTNRRKCSDDWSHYDGNDFNEDENAENRRNLKSELSFNEISDDDGDLANESKLKKYNVHPFSQAALTLLDEEIYSFCTYVRLTKSEINARQILKDSVTKISINLFDNDVMNTTNSSSSTNAKVTAFGSFASLDVCTFASDIDLALWGILEQNNVYQQEMERKKLCNEKKETKNRIKSTFHLQNQSGRQRRDERIQKWKDALNEVDNKKLKKESNDEIENETKINGNKANGDEPKSLNNNIMSTIYGTQTPTNMESMIEIDEQTIKIGDDQLTNPNADTDKSFKTTLENKDVQSLILGAGSDMDISSGSDSDSDSVEIVKCKFDESTFKDDDTHVDSDDDDAADKMEQYGKFKKEKMCEIKYLPPPSPSPSDIWPTSGSDSDSCSSQEVYLEDENDNIEVSCFVNDPNSCTKPASLRSSLPQNSKVTDESSSHSENDKKSKEIKIFSFGPTGKVRELVISLLRKVSKKLWKTGLIQSLHVRHKAKVPIVSLTTHMGIDGDIAIGGQNGMDTSKFASSWIERHDAFAPVVVLLKILLRQSELDKPFTGGLGSYKLYVLVAHHLEKHLKLGGSSRPSDIFLSLLYRYGDIQKAYDGPYNKIMTKLSKSSIVHSDNDGMADLSPVFKVENIVKLLGMSYKRLLSQYKKYKSNDVNKVSFLAAIIDQKVLYQDREMYYDKSKWRLKTQNRKRALIPFTQSMAHVRKVFKSANDKINGKTKYLNSNKGNTDEEEASKLMAGYGLKKNRSGDLVKLDD